MASSNPAFRNSPAFSDKPAVVARLQRPTPTQPMTAEQLTELYSRPSATPVETDRMSYEDTVVKTVVGFGILLAGAVVGWFFPLLFIPAALIGFVLALVNIFKRKPSPALVLSYAAVEGVFVGGISSYFETMFAGIVLQAVIATLIVVGVTLALFASGKIRASARATRVFLIAIIGYSVFSLVNVVLMLTGVSQDPWGLRSVELNLFGIHLPLGLVLGVLAVLLGAYSLVMDFDSIKTGVQRGAPRVYGWIGAFGIMVTVVWLYLEILRLLGIMRGR